MGQQSKVCRDILDTGAVLKNKVLETLIHHLAAEGKLSKDDCKNVSVLINKDIEAQLDSLVNRTVKNLD